MPSRPEGDIDKEIHHAFFEFRPQSRDHGVLWRSSDRSGPILGRRGRHRGAQSRTARADRFYNLVKIGYFNDVSFFRVIKGFMAQAGMNGDPAVSNVWLKARIPADPVKESNTKGMVTFAMGAQPDTRSAQFFVNYVNNSFLDASGFAPFGKVVEGFDSVKALYNGYGEGAPRGKGPSQGKLFSDGNAYLKGDFPKLDYIVSASIIE
jgi:peptidyl-prolyl cis-trans isomerase A (cyclophilin A)